MRFLLLVPTVVAFCACTPAAPPRSSTPPALAVAPYEPGPLPNTLCPPLSQPTAAFYAPPAVGTTALLIPPQPMPPGPPDAPAFLQTPEPVLTGTGDPRVDDYLRRVIQQGGPGWRPYLLRAFAGVRANAAVLRAIEPQPADAAAYVRRYVTPERVAVGQRLYRELQGRPLFQGEQKAPLEVLLALWGALSDYGANPPRFDMVEALANLGACGKGPHWAQFNIYEAVQIIAEGRIERSKARAYGDGRIGQTRFFTDQYLSWAEDGDGDGRIDIWTNRADILRNIQRNALGDWQAGLPIAFEIEPVAYDTSRPNDIRRLRASRGWEGVHRRVDGQPWPPGAEAMFGWNPLRVAGPDGPTFVVTRNFDMLRHQNPFGERYRSDPSPGFALATAILSERIAGRPGPSRLGG